MRCSGSNEARVSTSFKLEQAGFSQFKKIFLNVAKAIGGLLYKTLMFIETLI